MDLCWDLVLCCGFGLNTLLIVCGVRVGTLFCALVLGVKTRFIVGGVYVGTLFCAVDLG